MCELEVALHFSPPFFSEAGIILVYKVGERETVLVVRSSPGVRVICNSLPVVSERVTQ